MAAQPDLIAALVEFVADVPEVRALTDGRVFGGELPAEEQRFMPRAAVVVSPAGGSGAFGGGYQQYGDRRVDVHLYAATMPDADALWRALNPAMKQMRRAVHADCLLHWARSGGDPLTLRDPDTDWPYVLASYQVMAAEVAVSN